MQNRNETSLYACDGGILQKSEAVLVVVDDAVREINEQLGKATLSGGIVTKHGREGGVTERLWETLAESFARAGIVAEAMRRLVLILSSERG